MNEDFHKALEKTVSKIKGYSKEELEVKLKESEKTLFAKTINTILNKEIS